MNKFLEKSKTLGQSLGSTMKNLNTSEKGRKSSLTKGESENDDDNDDNESNIESNSEKGEDGDESGEKVGETVEKKVSSTKKKKGKKSETQVASMLEDEAKVGDKKMDPALLPDPEPDSDEEVYSKGGLRHHREILWFETRKRQECVNITNDVREIVKRSKVRDGYALVNAMSCSSTVFITEDSTALLSDMQKLLEKLCPYRGQYMHDRLDGTFSTDALLKRFLLGREVMIAITDGALDFGSWEQVFYGELDGQKEKKVLVKILGDTKAIPDDIEMRIKRMVFGDNM